MSSEYEFYDGYTQKNNSRMERNLKHKRHSDNLFKVTHNRLFFPKVVKRKSDNDKEYYKRYYRPHSSAYYKRKCNKQFRKYKGEVPSGNAYRRYTEYWYEIF